MPAVVACFAAGRVAPLVIGWALPYARPGEGSGRALTDEPRPWERALGLVLAGALVFALFGLRGLALGGATGDVLGAGIEVATLGALLAAVATA